MGCGGGRCVNQSTNVRFTTSIGYAGGRPVEAGGGGGGVEDLQLLKFIVGKAEFLWHGGGEWEGVTAPEVAAVSLRQALQFFIPQGEMV